MGTLTLIAFLFYLFSIEVDCVSSNNIVLLYSLIFRRSCFAECNVNGEKYSVVIICNDMYVHFFQKGFPHHIVALWKIIDYDGNYVVYFRLIYCGLKSLFIIRSELPLDETETKINIGSGNGWCLMAPTLTWSSIEWSSVKSQRSMPMPFW